MLKTVIYKCKNCGAIDVDIVGPLKIIICPICKQIMEKLDDDFNLCDITEIEEG